MDEPIIYCRWTSPLPFLKMPAECLYDELRNAIMLDEKGKFRWRLNIPEIDDLNDHNPHIKHLLLTKLNLDMILRSDAPKIAMAILNGGTIDHIYVDHLALKYGWTPLHLASATPSPKLIKCLIQRGDRVDVPRNYPPLNLKLATALDLALEVIDSGYENGFYATNRPWTLRCSIFELFDYVCQLQKTCLEVIRLLVQNTQNKERVRKVFIDSANEGKFVKVAALFLAAPELFLSTSLGGGSMSSIDELYLKLNSLDKRTDIQDGLLLLLDVFDLVGHKLVAYVRLNDPKVWKLSFNERKYKISFLLREAAHKKLGISSSDVYLLSLFKPVSQHAIEPPCIPPPSEFGDQIHIGNMWALLPFPMRRKNIDIDYVNRMIPNLKPHEADVLRKAIDNKLSTMPNICTLVEGTTRIPNKEEKQRSSFPSHRSIELSRARLFDTKTTNAKCRLDLCRLDFKLIPRSVCESRVMKSTKLESFISDVRLSHFSMIAKRLIK